ncbi:hypothetical protein GQ53DRAFT_671809 [Thozetella sp. PMI_491]|nr:hypothetical protein GQ53DRAFT_671809 [Thozetella sp. PMI_491]
MVTYVATYGKDPKMARSVQEALQNQDPPIEVVHTCLELEKAETELPALCAGQTDIVPASGLGTNATAPAAERKVPSAVFFGGDLKDADYDKIVSAVQAKSPSVRFIKCGKLDVIREGALGPNPAAIARVYKKKLALPA